MDIITSELPIGVLNRKACEVKLCLYEYRNTGPYRGEMLRLVRKIQINSRDSNRKPKYPHIQFFSDLKVIPITELQIFFILLCLGRRIPTL